MCLFGLGVWEGWLAPEMNHRPSGAEQEVNEKKRKMRGAAGPPIFFIRIFLPPVRGSNTPMLGARERRTSNMLEPKRRI